jgi:hypothetical protein
MGTDVLIVGAGPTGLRSVASHHSDVHCGCEDVTIARILVASDKNVIRMARSRASSGVVSTTYAFPVHCTRAKSMAYNT